MKRLTLAALVALALSPGVLHAQLGPYAPPTTNNPYQRPTMSPYLNMLRPGANPAINYYGLVRPQMQTNRTLQTFQQELTPVASGLFSTAQQQVGVQIPVPTTGHQVQFYNYGTYFQGVNSTSSGTLGGTNPGNRPQFGTLGGSRAPQGGIGR